MTPLILYITGFIACAVIILLAGKKLSYFGDIIAEKKGWGKMWAGLMLMATVTSLPELMVGISSSAIVQSADLAVGDILGSCAFNLGLLAMLDAIVPKNKHIFYLASPHHVMAATFGIILFSFVGFGIFLPQPIVLTSWIAVSSIAFIVIYLVSIRIIFLFEQKNKKESSTGENIDTQKGDRPLKKIVQLYILFALLIIACALTLPWFAKRIADESGLETSFVGTLFLAISTSLPEIAVSIAAVRMGAIDMAVGSLLGSNIFNIFILAIDDIFYTKGHILKFADEKNLSSVFSVILMSAIVIIGLTYRTEGKRFKLAWDAFVIFIVYVANIIILYQIH